MLVFIDESGDTGFKVGKGSTQNFVVACVIFKDNLEAEKTSVAIKELKRELKVSDDFEFKFSKCSKKFRTKFLEKVRKFDFQYRAVVMIKERIYGKELRRKRESFHNYSMKMLIKHSIGTIENATLFIDGSGDRQFRRDAQRYLKRECNELENIVKNVKFQESHRSTLIQLADMIAGTVNRSFTDKRDHKHYRKLIKKREGNVWDFGDK